MANSSSNSNYKVVPEATEALNKFKYEVASEVGVKILFKKLKLHLKLLHIQKIHYLTYFLISFIDCFKFSHFILFFSTNIS